MMGGKTNNTHGLSYAWQIKLIEILKFLLQNQVTVNDIIIY